MTWTSDTMIRCAIASLAAGVGYAQESATAVRIDGTRVTATLVDMDDRWRPRLRTAEGVHRWSESELLRWGSFRDRDRGNEVLFDAGSVLSGGIPAMDQERIELESQAFLTEEFPRENVRGIVWRIPSDTLQRDRLRLRLASEARERDVVEMANGDLLTGRVLSMGTIGEDLLKGINTEFQVLPAPGQKPFLIPAENVVAVGLSSRIADRGESPLVHALLGLRDGSRLWTSKILREGKQLQISLLDGPALVADEATFWQAVTGIQMFGQHIIYLSDLPTLGYKHIPFLSESWDYGLDRSVAGGVLRVGGQVYLKGLSMHATSRLAYQLDRRYRRFESEIAIDDAADGLGSVVFRVLTERQSDNQLTPNWVVDYESPIVRGGDAPLRVSVDATRAIRLALVVEFADRGDTGDHANWLNARLIQ